ncbi:MAG: RidA family protein [Candidatus Kapaibacteriota bacterium]
MFTKKLFFSFIVLVLISCSGYRLKKEIIYTEGAPKPIGPYSQAVKVGKFIFISGQIGINPQTGAIEEGLEAQFVRIMENIKNILKEANSDLTKVLKVTLFLKDLNSFDTINKLYSNYFTNEFPARETVEVSRLPKDAKVEISVIAISKDSR